MCRQLLFTFPFCSPSVPPPPSNLTIQVRSGKNALVSWDPPAIGGYSIFKLKVISLSDTQNSNRNFEVSQSHLPFNLRELTPGASYEIQLYTIYEEKESAAYISSNFTTRKFDLLYILLVCLSFLVTLLTCLSQVWLESLSHSSHRLDNVLLHCEIYEHPFS